MASEASSGGLGFGNRLVTRGVWVSHFQPKLKPYKYNTYCAQVVSLAQKIHIGASLTFISHSKPKL